MNNSQRSPALSDEDERELDKLSSEVFIEEINLLNMEGWLFCFDKREAARRKPGVYEHTLRDGSTLRIELSSYGQPGILAYKVMQAIFRAITKDGFPYPDRVGFTRYSLSHLIGRERYSSKDGRELAPALLQLRNTSITIIRTDKKPALRAFSVLQEVAVVFEDDSELKDITQRAPQAFYAILSDAIKKSIEKGHIAIFNWKVLEQLEPMEATLYKRLYFNLANILEAGERQGTDTSSLQLKKSYSSLCREWLGGLTTHRYRSQVEQQLAPTLLQLKKVGFLRSYAIEPNAKGDGFNISFRPGKQFFKDYELLFRNRYRPQLQFENATNQAEYSEPIDLVLAFYKKLKGTDRASESVTRNEIVLAQQLIQRLGHTDAYALLDFAIASAKSTKWDVKWFQAIARYEPDFLSSKQARQQAQLAVEEAEKARQAQALTDAYEDYLKDHVTNYLNSLSDEARQELEQQAQVRLKPQPGQSSTVVSMGIRIAVRGLAQELNPPLSFEEWNRQRRHVG